MRVQVGEAILPLGGVSAGELGDQKIRVFRLNDGQHEMGYAFAEVIDFATIDNDVIHAENPGEISGVSLINGEPAELVDAHWLFANHVGTAARATEALVCRLPSDDPWMQNMLRPIVEAAGYTVIGHEDEATADLVIASQGETVDGACAIYLRSDPEPEEQERREHLPVRPGRAAAGPQVGRSGEGQVKELLLVVTIAGERVALPSAAVESVVELDTLIPVPRAAPHVAGLSALRSRVLTVIDCMRSLELGETDCSDGIREAAVVELDGHHYALDRRSRRRRGRSRVGPGSGSRRNGFGLGARVDRDGRNRKRAAAAGRCRRVDRGRRNQSGSLSSSLPLTFSRSLIGSGKREYEELFDRR